ncbi:MAG TPA: glycosyltransferase [Terriglobales bacterium]
MKLACFHPASVFCAWAVATGLVDTLNRMGHPTDGFPVDVTKPGIDPAKYPTAEELKKYDGILISGPEHVRGHLLKLYPRWDKIRVPKVSWLHETVEREDYGRMPLADIRQFADFTFCAAVQDEKHGLTWLPFGVDTEVFKPDWGQKKEYEAAFIGLVYPKRAAFLETLKPHLKEVSLLLGNVQVLDLGGVRIRETAILYAENLRKIKVFVNLPSLSELVVTKVYESLACGTFLITPAIASQKNYDNILAHYYDPAKPADLAERIRFCLKNEEERQQAARTCCEQVHRLDRLELRCEVLLNKFQTC